jgi:hypothetical protein
MPQGGFIMQELIELLGFWHPSSLSHSTFQVGVFVPCIVTVWPPMCSLGWGGSLAMMVSMYEHPIICTFFHGLLLSKRNKSFWWGSFLWLHPVQLVLPRRVPFILSCVSSMHDQYIEKNIRVIHKGRKIQHQYPDSWSYTVSFNNNLKKKVPFKVGWSAENHRFLWFLSCILLFLSASTAATYVSTAPTCTTTIIGLEPCALDAKTLYNFQHSIMRF